MAPTFFPLTLPGPPVEARKAESYPIAPGPIPPAYLALAIRPSFPIARSGRLDYDRLVLGF